MSTPPRDSGSRLSAFRFVLQSLAYHRRMNAAVGLGVLVGTAVLTGALLVGDSVRGSLEALTLDRLGNVDDALVTDRFFRMKLADELAERIKQDAPAAHIWPVMLLQGSVTNPDNGARASQVSLLGGTEGLWQAIDPELDKAAMPGPAFGEVVLNEPLAAELQVQVGQEVLVRLPSPSDVPRDSPLGKKTETVTSRRLRVSAILPAKGLGAFGLRPNQRLPKNAFLNLATLQDATEQKDKVNALLATSVQNGPLFVPNDLLQKNLRPTLEDYGLFVKSNPRGYFNLGGQRMLIDPPAAHALSQVDAKITGPRQAVLTYLANTIAVGKREVPYSTIAAIEFDDEPPLGPFKTLTNENVLSLADDEILLNQWTADDLQAKVGDEVRIDYFEPESTHGEVRERSATFRLKGIVPLSGVADDPDLTPELKGVTDQLSIGDWNPPFPYESERVREKDEDYWDDHRATPKAFVSLTAGQKLWRSRFGDTTTIRIPQREALKQEGLEKAWAEALDKQSMGFEFRAVKQQGLEASRGTTPFSVLFLGFSFFIIGAAVMLVALLFRLGIDRRAREIGVLHALGFNTKQVRRMLLVEGLMVAKIGSLVGAVVGIGYAWLMLAGLRTWWLAAVTTPFLTLHVTPLSLVIGYLSGVITSLLAILWSLRAMRHVSVRQLLAGDAELPPGLARIGTRRSAWVIQVCIFLAMLASVAGGWLQGEAQAGVFFGAGALVLAAALAFIWSRLRTGGTGALINAGSMPLARLALRNAARHPGRSTLTIGLMGSAVFLIVAISAFHLDPPEAVERRDTGTGGFLLVAESDQPLFQNLNSEDGRFELGFADKDEKLLAQTDIIPFRVQPGDDASCLNLYQTEQPRVLGVTPAMIARGGFAWTGTDATTPEEQANPWLLLDRKTDRGVPVFLDAATAMYSLHLSGVGATFEIPNGSGEQVPCVVAGLFKNSIFQGAVLMNERNFLQEFPDASGYRFFLVGRREVISEPRTPNPELSPSAVERTLEKTLGDFGFDAQPSIDRLAGFLAVQNTYLLTFQSLGGLGLLLGTFGLGVVQLRNVLERRGELALLQAAGFSRALLARMVMLENASLLLGGLGVGALAALVAIAPHLLGGGAAIPWNSLAITLAIVLVTGLAAGLLAVRAVLAAPLLQALRAA